jgi:3-methyl-2-oxobutanoate hydroxymethyltransferase
LTGGRDRLIACVRGQEVEGDETLTAGSTSIVYQGHHCLSRWIVSSAERLVSLLATADSRSPMIWLGLYDSAFAALAVVANADGLVVGDSVGPNALGLEGTDDVTLDHMVHHASAVRRGAPGTPIIVDLPMQTQRLAPEHALPAALHLWRESRADAIKLEGSDPDVTTLSAALRGAGVTVCAHLVRVQASMDRHVEAAVALRGAGVSAAVVQGFSPEESDALRGVFGVPTIGVEQRNGCDGVVMNAYRALGILAKNDSPNSGHDWTSGPMETLRQAVEAQRRSRHRDVQVVTSS